MKTKSFFTLCTALLFTLLFLGEKAQGYVGQTLFLDGFSFYVLTEDPFSKTGTVAVNSSRIFASEPYGVSIPQSLAFEQNPGFSYLVTEVGINCFNNDRYCTGVELPDSVTRIGYGAFQDAYSLKDIVLPKYLAAIEKETFAGCSSLESIFLPDDLIGIGERAFAGCFKLTTINLENITSIAPNAFEYCHALENVNISSKTEYLGERAFQTCNNLKHVKIGNGLQYIESHTFYDCKALESVEIGNGVQIIGTSAFSQCKNLSSVTIGSSVQFIEPQAFYNCQKLNNLFIPPNVHTIRSEAFYGCSGLENLTLSEGLNEISTKAFHYCTALLEVIIPHSVTLIRNEAFSHCSSLTNLVIGDGVTRMGDRAFTECRKLEHVHLGSSLPSLPYGCFDVAISLKELVIPDNITFLSDLCLSSCTSLTNLILPQTLVHIGKSALHNCTSLEHLSLPRELASIGAYAFGQCYSLKSLVFPPNLMSIGDNAFGSCKELNSLYFRGDAPLSVGKDLFENASEDVTIYYKPGTAGWPEPHQTWHGVPVLLWEEAGIFSLEFFRIKDIKGFQNATLNEDAQMPLIPTTQMSALESSLEPVSRGLIADGVTPLIIKIHENGAAHTPQTCRLSLIHTSQRYDSPLIKGLGQHLCLIQNGEIRTANEEGELEFTIPAHPNSTYTLYAFISPIESYDMANSSYYWELFDFEARIGLLASKENPEEGERFLAHRLFDVSKPPIVLIHDLNAGESMKYLPSVLSNYRPAELIYPITYGCKMNLKTGRLDNTANTIYPLFDYDPNRSLVHILDQQLKKEIEGTPTTERLWKEWAWTRYDVIAHGQGGLLTRMLCASEPVWGGQVLPFRNKENFNRGRFHFIVTIGTPHNGTSLARYLLELEKLSNSLFSNQILPEELSFLKYFRDKFDPWGPQMQIANHPNCAPDPGDLFHLIRSFVDSNSEAYSLLGLKLSGNPYWNKGTDIVLKGGSDGIIDGASQFEGCSSVTHQSGMIAHCEPAKLLGATTYSYVTQMTSYDLITTAARLLTSRQSGNYNPDASPPFTPFTQPKTRDAAWKKQIEDFAALAILSFNPKILEFDWDTSGDIFVKFAQNISGQASSEVTPAAARAIQWSVVYYGPEEMDSENAATWVTDPQDPYGIQITPRENLQGDIVVSALYEEQENLFYGAPMRVYSQPIEKEITAILCKPEDTILDVGAGLTPELWAIYEDGSQGRLFIDEDSELELSSSNPDTLAVDGRSLKALARGEATLSASWGGFHCNSGYQVGYAQSYSIYLYNGRAEDGTFWLWWPRGALQIAPTHQGPWVTYRTEPPYQVPFNEENRFYRIIEHLPNPEQ